MLTKEALEKFKDLYHKRFGEKLNDDEAYQKANRLLDLYKIIYSSTSSEQIREARNPNENNDL